MSRAPDLSGFTKQQIKDKLNQTRHPVEIAIYNSENSFNVGAIIRTCHQFLVSKIHLIDIHWWYKKADMGTRKYENIEKHSLNSFIETFKGRNIVCFERRPELQSVELYSYSYPQNPIFVFGAEKTGVPDDLLSIGQNTVSIPQYGIHNDLNLSVAVGIVIYDWTHKFYDKRR